MTNDDDQLDDRLLHRMLFFTDAVFAIVLTLLVLELRPPELSGPHGAANAFAEMGSHFLAFFMSFALIGILWAAHMNMTRRLIHFDWPSAWANLLFLFPVCLIPFASAWFGKGLGVAFVWEVYCWVLVATSAASVVLVLVITRGQGRLMAGGTTRRELVYRLVRAATPGIAFGVGLIGLAYGQLRLAYFCWALIPILFASSTLLRPHEPKAEIAAAEAA